MQYYERMRGGENLGRGELKKKREKKRERMEKKKEKSIHIHRSMSIIH